VEEEEQDGSDAPSDTQAARTILMLSSPTRPAPRTLNQNYISEMHSGSPTQSPLGEWITPYSPMTSSPLVQFQTMDSNSNSPSPDRTPTLSSLPTQNILADKEMGSSPSSSSHQRGSSYPTLRPPKQTYANLYEPSSPSPLSTALFPSSSASDHLDRFKTHSRSSSPTLKRAVRFAAAATQGSLDLSSGLSVERIKDKISGLTGRGEYNSASDAIHPGSQPGHDDKKEYSPSPSYASPSGTQYAGTQGPSTYVESYLHLHHQRDTTPPPQPASSTQYGSSSSNLSVPGSSYMHNSHGNNAGHHGMRTPPPSGGKDIDVSQYSSMGTQGSSTMRMRRDSGMAQAGATNDLTTLLRRGAPS